MTAGDDTSAEDADQADEPARPRRRGLGDTGAAWSFSAESQTFDEAFGFPRVAGDDARRRFGAAPGDRVLDVGCGTGALLRFLLPALQGEGVAVGVDRDPDLLALADGMTPDPEDGGNHVHFGAADAFDLPFGDDAFDVVASGFLLCILPEPLDALREMVRVCRPAGTVASVSCFCKSGGLPRFRGVQDWKGRDRFEELDRRFREIYRTTVRNPGLGLPNGRDLAVWGAYNEAGLVEPRIAGYMPTFAPADADWTEGDVAEYLERRERVDLGLLDGLDEAALAALEEHGFSGDELEELRALTAEHYRRLRADPAAARTNMDVWVDPMVLVTGRVPR